MNETADSNRPTANELLALLGALASPQRLRIVALLVEGRQYVSQLARDVGLSRPLVHMHLKKLEAAGLVVSHLELSEEGKAMRYFEITPFSLALTPEVIAAAARTLGTADATREDQEGR
jgi:DNA-binding transcriptional ArsR family regulator